MLSQRELGKNKVHPKGPKTSYRSQEATLGVFFLMLKPFLGLGIDRPIGYLTWQHPRYFLRPRAPASTLSLQMWKTCRLSQETNESHHKREQKAQPTSWPKHSLLTCLPEHPVSVCTLPILLLVHRHPPCHPFSSTLVGQGRTYAFFVFSMVKLLILQIYNSNKSIVWRTPIDFLSSFFFFQKLVDIHGP